MQNDVVEISTSAKWRQLRSLLAALCILAMSAVAVLAQNSVTLAWDPNSESDLAGYIVRYGVASGYYTNSTVVGNTTNAVVSGLVSGVTYYFVVVAYNTSDLQSDPSNEVTASFTPPPPPSNTPPTLSVIANRTISEDTTSPAIGFTIGDAETPAANLVVSFGSSDPNLVPNSNITLGGSGSSRTVTVRPAINQTGTATITLVVSDGFLTTNRWFNVTVTNVNDAPTITSINNQIIDEDSATSAIGFTVADVDTAATNLTLSGSSSNPTLVPNSRITFGGSGGSRSVVVQPAANQSGIANIIVTVSDGTATASRTFSVTVRQVDDAPTNQPPVITLPIAVIADKDSSQVLSGISVADPDAGTSNVTVRLSVNHGTVSINSDVAAGLTASQITSNGSAAVTIFAPLSAINTTLRATNGCIYLSDAGFIGADLLTAYANDHGNTGDGGPQTNTKMCLLSVIGSGFENWRSQAFSPEVLADTNSEAAVWGDNADPDSDGRENLLEFALGSDPNYGEAAVDGIATDITEIKGKSYLTISFNRRRTDTTVSYVVETSTDGLRWRSGRACVRDLGAVEIDQGFERVTCRDALPLSALRPRFIRLKVIKTEL